MDELTYQETDDGGFNVLKSGAIVGYVPKDHPQTDDIKKRLKDGNLPQIPKAPPPAEPAVKRSVNLQKLGDLLVQKGIITAEELDAASDTVRG